MTITPKIEIDEPVNIDNTINSYIIRGEKLKLIIKMEHEHFSRTNYYLSKRSIDLEKQLYECIEKFIQNRPDYTDNQFSNIGFEFNDDIEFDYSNLPDDIKELFIDIFNQLKEKTLMFDEN